jgi:hypothetical protein
MSKVDDHGLFDARLSILRASLYPLRTDTVTEDNCLQWLTACINARLLIVYQIDGKPYLKMLDTQWQVRSASKYPLPNNKCKQLKAPVYLDVVRCTLYGVVDVVVDVVVGAPVDNSPTADSESPPPFEKEANVKTLESRAAAVGVKRKAGEKNSIFLLRVASAEAEGRART